jgi:pimeloyl-ACP methyl ester carboxylesterase
MAEDPVGDWQGTLKTGGAALRLAVHIHKTPAGVYDGALDSLDQHANGIPLAAVASDGSKLSFTVPTIGARYDATWSDTAHQWVGEFNQGGTGLALTLARGEAPPAKAVVYRTAPWPYAEREVTVTGKAAGVTLAGVLTTPDGPGPFPAVILIAGSGPQNRDEEVFGHPIFAVIADHLARKGIAVLRYDKRGIGASTGDYSTATSTDFAADAEAVARFLATQPKIDPRHIGLVGHSEGGIVGPMVARSDPHIAFVVLMAGPGVNGDAIIMAQQRAILQATSVPPAQRDEKAAQQRRILDVVEKAPDHASAVTTAAAELRAMGVPEARVDAEARLLGSDWYRFFLTYDPAPALRALHVPVLAMIGSKDTQVPPDQNLPALRAALAGNPDATVVELPNLNHLFQTATTGSPNEYGQIAEHVSPVALDRLSDWIVNHTRGR